MKSIYSIVVGSAQLVSALIALGIYWPSGYRQCIDAYLARHVRYFWIKTSCSSIGLFSHSCLLSGPLLYHFWWHSFPFLNEGKAVKVFCMCNEEFPLRWILYLDLMWLFFVFRLWWKSSFYTINVSVVLLLCMCLDVCLCVRSSADVIKKKRASLSLFMLWRPA